MPLTADDDGFLKKLHGNLADQSRWVGPSRGADTTQ